MKDPDTFLYWKMQFIGKMSLIDRNIKAVMGGIDLFKLKKGELIFFYCFALFLIKCAYFCKKPTDK